ncbi:MAG: DUF4384 domain-containing protein [Gemmatimonadales bacterium]
MISAFLLSFALAGARADSGSAATIATEDPPIQLWINDSRLLPGDPAKVQVRTREDGYLLVLHVDTEGHLRVLFPLDPKDDDFVRGGRKYEIRGRGGRESFTADSRTDRGTIYAAVSSDPYKFDGYVLGDHWDYRALAPNRLASDPEAELNDLVRHMSQDDFDYDLLTYDVVDRADYADYSTPYYAPDYYGSCFSCGYYSPYRSGFSVSLIFGRPYRRSYYSPFFPAYDPFYDPFFYDPYYYPAFYRPFYPPRAYNPGYYFPYPHYYGYYNTPGTRYSSPYTPYRFRGNDAVLTGYRGRGFSGVRAINTVYMPPRSRVIQPGVSSPARRLADPRDVAQPGGTPAARRDGRAAESRPAERDRQVTTPVGGRRQPQSGNAEARRSRQETMPQDVSPRREITPRNDATPREVTPRRAEVDRPQIERAPVAPSRNPEPEARPAPRQEPSRSAPPPSSTRSGGGDRGGDRSGGGGRSDTPTTRSWGGSGGGGGGSGGGGQAPSGGGGRRR